MIKSWLNQDFYHLCLLRSSARWERRGRIWRICSPSRYCGSRPLFCWSSWTSCWAARSNSAGCLLSCAFPRSLWPHCTWNRTWNSSGWVWPWRKTPACFDCWWARSDMLCHWRSLPGLVWLVTRCSGHSSCQWFALLLSRLTLCRYSECFCRTFCSFFNSDGVWVKPG